MVLVLPFICAYATNALTRNKSRFKDFLFAQSDNLQLLFLCLAVVMLFAFEGKSLLENPLLLAQMFVPPLIFFAVLFFIAQVVGRIQFFRSKTSSPSISPRWLAIRRSPSPSPWRPFPTGR